MKNYYLLRNGRLSRKDNTLFVENTETHERKPIPVEDVESLYLYGEIDLNTRVLNFLAQKHIPLHVFNYYGHYAGSYYPREYLNSGFLMVQQARHYSDAICRVALARELVHASAHSILRTVAYYANRKHGDPDPPAPAGFPEETAAEGATGPGGSTASGSGATAAATVSAAPDDAPAEQDVDAALRADRLEDPAGAASDGGGPEVPPWRGDPHSLGGFEPEVGQPVEWLPDDDGSALEALLATIEQLRVQINLAPDVPSLLGVEGKIRERYYATWRHILSAGSGFSMERRVRRPPDNEINALISFGNSILYTACLGELYRTQLTPTISYLHQPGARRYSLALDLSEIFKPLIVDRTIFKLVNTRQLQPSHFSQEMEGCYLTDDGKRLFLTALDERFRTTIRHRTLNRSVSYRHLIRLECYKLIRHLTGLQPYRAFRAWW